MILEYGGYSHKGMVRKSNEDYYYIPSADKIQDLAMIADGMGGHNAGELASRMAVETAIEYLTHRIDRDGYSQDPAGLIEEAIGVSNGRIFDVSLANEAYNGMGTTLITAYFSHEILYLGHVGDSRGYLIRGGSVKQLTKDHSLVQELLDNGTITPDEVDKHPQKNIITRALGTENVIDIDCHKIALKENDIILLCTDGLILHVDLQESIDLVESAHSMQELALGLVDQAVERGGLDNVTVVAIKYISKKKEG
ncbi:MAG TPA: Stp1/IreP family PP2C-type Ser/Thr phosphatase [Clostridia bacterium]|nr:Stp1/IreP family PP2C-type Ser/Thr phosphatase [Clostridia bacterium]